mmetsp:Transcript_81321/g.230811  ORF Transcript_81321/g.230811 Transcript_81321/m.230811 type:complete len:325 (-) Transcript_81321:309-1283(-)
MPGENTQAAAEHLLDLGGPPGVPLAGELAGPSTATGGEAVAVAHTYAVPGDLMDELLQSVSHNPRVKDKLAALMAQQAPALAPATSAPVPATTIHFDASDEEDEDDEVDEEEEEESQAMVVATSPVDKGKANAGAADAGAGWKTKKKPSVDHGPLSSLSQSPPPDDGASSGSETEEDVPPPPPAKGKEKAGPNAGASAATAAAEARDPYSFHSASSEQQTHFQPPSQLSQLNSVPASASTVMDDGGDESSFADTGTEEDVHKEVVKVTLLFRDHCRPGRTSLVTTSTNTNAVNNTQFPPHPTPAPSHLVLGFTINSSKSRSKRA